MSRLSSHFLRNRSVQRSLLCAAGLTVGVSTELLHSDSSRSFLAFHVSNVNLSPTRCSSLKKEKEPSQREATKPMELLPREPRLNGKVAIVTGASRGLGQAIAIRFVQEGSKVGT
jgi:hypothetical protein